MKSTCVDYAWNSITIDENFRENQKEHMVFGFKDENGEPANFAKDAYLLFDFPTSSSWIYWNNPRFGLKFIRKFI